MSHNMHALDDVDTENRHNLTALWALYGAQELGDKNQNVPVNAPSVVMQNSRWPHRCWFQETPESHAGSEGNDQTFPLFALRNALIREAILPLWADISEHHKHLEAQLRAEVLITNSNKPRCTYLWRAHAIAQRKAEIKAKLRQKHTR